MLARALSLPCLFASLVLFACGSPQPGAGSGDAHAAGAPGAGGAAGGAGLPGQWAGGASSGAGGGSGGAGTAGTGASGGAAGGGGSGGSSAACAPGAAGPTSVSLEASGPITVASNTTYSGLRIQNPNGPCITVNDASNVVIVDSDLGPCGGDAAIVVNGSKNVTIEQSHVHHSARGVMAQYSTDVKTLKNVFDDISGKFPAGTAVEYDYMAGGGSIEENCMLGSFDSDVISGFESSNLKIVANEVHATITEASAAGFTIGDSVNGSPGHDNYVAKNVVYQTGGVPPGVFGSSGNTLLELNCLPTGVQAYAYNGPFVGVTVQKNVIGPGSFVPDPSAVQGWETNTFTADGNGCAP